jgi:hypothetical protein
VQIQRLAHLVIGGAGARAERGEMCDEAPEGSAIGEQDGEVIQPESSP